MLTLMTETDAVTPFVIDIHQSELDDLTARLERTRFPAPLPGDGWDTGVPIEYLRELVGYWKDEYDWRAAETEINQMPQFTTTIDGQTIHFLHVRSEATDATPLLLTHGWPGSFVEFLDVIEPLANPVDGEPAFHLVIPTLPGFGFSTPLIDPGWTTARIARAWDALMNRLGYNRYGVQGGDIGAAVSPEIARIATDRVIGVHINGNVGAPVDGVSDEEREQLSEVERDRVARIEAFMTEEFGYISIQSTRPQLLAAGLTDSPAGQLAWIIDKFRQWTYPRSALPDTIVDRDRMLTNVMLYWLTGSAGSSAYVGYASDQTWGDAPASSGVPTGVIIFAHDVGIRRYAQADHNIVRWTDVEDRGGHFAALEEPQILVEDIRSFFADLR